jgi:lipopolysaccharide/colanic/teichoic acid biosynthesis glycosyltransferase
MIKRISDIILSLVLLVFLSPIIFFLSILIFIQDFNTPFYISNRIGKNKKKFKLYKFRSMIVNADKSGVNSTSDNDKRITKLGNFLRKYKIDEIMQLLNVVKNEMSFVGPRPNVEADVKLYSLEEEKLLSVKPGITDFSSIVFSDEGEILSSSQNPDYDYNRLIRPWKSKLGLIYIEKKNFFLDLTILFLTFLNLFNRIKTLSIINSILKRIDTDTELHNIVLRKNDLKPSVAPGFIKPYEED